MVAKVIPSLRTPRHVALFDYAIPEGMEINVGDLVRIPFRTKIITGVVRSITDDQNSGRDLKCIESKIEGLHLDLRTLELLDVLAGRSFSSAATVFNAWVGTLPKKITFLSPPSSPKLDDRASIQTARFLLDHWHASEGVIAMATRAKNDGKRVLILTPWTEPARVLADALDACILTSDLSSGARFRAWSGFLRGEHQILVATRIGAWLSTEADVVILDEPENDDHKQDELAPRYDARWVVDEAAHRGIEVVEIGLTPRLRPGATQCVAPTIDLEIHPVDLSSRDWSSIGGIQGRTLLLMEEAREENQPIAIIHPIHGDRARLRCADCGWTAICTRCGAGPSLESGSLVCHRCHWRGDAISDCPSCGSVRLSKSRPGRDTMIVDLKKQGFENVAVMSLGEWNNSGYRLQGAGSDPGTPPPLPGPLLILTDLSLLPGGGEDIRRRERLIIAFRRLADRCASIEAALVVQSSAELLTDAKTWLTSEGCMSALNQELTERKSFNLPPAAQLIKLICRGSEANADKIKRALMPGALGIPGSSLAGPYAVERLPNSRTPRWILHLTLPLTTPKTAIQALLQPILATDVLIDLDPIAFFE